MLHLKNRTLGLSIAACALLGSANPVSAQFHHFESKLVAGNFVVPVAAEQPIGETSKVIVAERTGILLIVDNGVVSPTPFIDFSAKVDSTNAMGGLVGFTVHPEYPTNGYFYVYYSVSTTEARLIRYQVPVPGSYVVDPASETLILTVTTPGLSSHMGGGMRFGRDGKLYLAIGDMRSEVIGGFCTSQDGTSLLGKMVRLNDDGTIPADNPFVGDPTMRDEVFAIGFRQPFKLDIDALTGDMYIGDVGEAFTEEVNFLPGTSGGGQNFGWRAMEGLDCTGSFLCTSPPCGDPSYTPPVHAYPHALVGGKIDCAVIGGPIYRGTEIPELWGTYIFTDWCSGRFWSFKYDGTTKTDFQQITSALQPGGSLEIRKPTSFGLSSSGEIFILDGGNPEPGELYQVVPKPLDADIDTISLTAGGVQSLELLTDPAYDGNLAVLLGSISGTTPGQAFGSTVVPLNPDGWFNFTANNPNTPPLSNSLALLAGGTTTSSITVPTTLSPTFVGLQVNHAYVIFDPGTGQILDVSNPEDLTFTP